jgi:hypothetical protein
MQNNAWRPIETAPRDGTDVLVAWRYNSESKTRIAHAMYVGPLSQRSDADDAIYDEKRDEYFLPDGWYQMYPFHDEYLAIHIRDAEILAWMPMPPAPEAAG